MSEAAQPPNRSVSERRIRFVERTADGDVVSMTFEDPAPRYAIQGTASARTTGEVAGRLRDPVLDVVLLPLSAAPQPAPQEERQGFAEWLEKINDPDAPLPVIVKYRGVELMWRPGRVLLQCDPEQAELLLSAVIEFTHYECELRRIENEIAGGWVELQQDKSLAFEVTGAGLDRSAVVGQRMDRVLERRIRLARIEPHLYAPDVRLPVAARKLGEELREKARTEARLETADGQLEVFEDVYEMSGQRMGEYRAARQEHVLEWVIILLLAAELLLMLVQTAWRVRL